MLGRYVLGIKEQRLIFQLFWFFHRTWFSCFGFSLKEGAVCLWNSIWIFHGGMIMKLFFSHKQFGSWLPEVFCWNPFWLNKKTPNLWCSYNGLPLNTWDRCLPTLSERLEKTSEMGIHTVPLPLLFYLLLFAFLWITVLLLADYKISGCCCVRILSVISWCRF